MPARASRHFARRSGEGGRRGASPLRATFWGYVGQLVNKGDGGSNQLVRLIGAEKFEQLVAKLVEADTFSGLPLIRSYLQTELRQQQEETGVYEDLQLPSGVYVLSYFANIVQGVEKSQRFDGAQDPLPIGCGDEVELLEIPDAQLGHAQDDGFGCFRGDQSVEHLAVFGHHGV